MSTTSVHQLRCEKGRRREIGGQLAGSDRQVISLLEFLEEENKNLRRAVVDLSLENLLLRSSTAS